MSEIEQVKAALLNVTTAFAMAIAQRPRYTSMALDLIRLVENEQWDELAQLGANMSEQIAQARADEAH